MLDKVHTTSKENRTKHIIMHQHRAKGSQRMAKNTNSSTSSSIPPRPQAHHIESNPMAPIMNLPNENIPPEFSICKYENNCKQSSCRYVHDYAKLRPPPSFLYKMGIPHGFLVRFVDWTGSTERVFEVQSERFYPSKYLRALELDVHTSLPTPRLCHK